MVLGKRLENRSACLCEGPIQPFALFTWNKIQFTYRNKFQLKYVLQSANGNFKKICPVDQEVLHSEEI